MNTRHLDSQAVKSIQTMIDALVSITPGPTPYSTAYGIKELPQYYADGTEIDSVKALSDYLGVGIMNAARIAIEQKDVNVDLLVEAKNLVAPPDSDRGGICMFLQPGMASAEGIASQIETALPPEELHLTLAYFGTIDELGDKLPFSRVLSWGEEIARQGPGPFFARLNGISRFNGKGKDAIVLNVDAPETEEYRKNAMDFFGNYVNRFHGYTPHMTVGYLDSDADWHIQRTPPIDDVYFEYLTVAYGSQYIRIKLTNPNTTKPEPEDAPEVHAELTSLRTFSPIPVGAVPTERGMKSMKSNTPRRGTK